MQGSLYWFQRVGGIALAILCSVQVAFSHKYVDIYMRKVTDYQIDFYAENRNYCPYQVLVNLDVDYTKQSLSADLPYYTVIQPLEKNKLLFSLISLDKLPDDIRFRSQIDIGDPDSSVTDTNFLYLFPFEDGTERKVSQGYSTRFSHKGWTRYSVDFGMEIGTPVCAARDGIVVDYNVSSSKGGRRKWYRQFANFITLYHQDGTFSQYVHLKQGGCIVEVGDVVKAGQVIGYSGNTGWTSGPHLHFMVYKPIPRGRQTIPTRFLGKDNTPIEIIPKHYYTSYHNFTPTSPFSLRTNIAAISMNTNLAEETNNVGGP